MLRHPSEKEIYKSWSFFAEEFLLGSFTHAMQDNLPALLVGAITTSEVPRILPVSSDPLDSRAERAWMHVE
jgi:hypothetical protein